MDGSGEEMDGREETWAPKVEGRKKKRGRRKLNESIFVISPLICPKCQLFYDQS